MKRIIAHCGIGYVGVEHEDEFCFDDNITDQFLEVWWEEKDEH